MGKLEITKCCTIELVKVMLPWFYMDSLSSL